MAWLIDGYNLLFASDVFVREAPTLARTREALLAFLAERLSESERRRTMVVFDAGQAPPGLPAELAFAGMSVRFARRRSSADELLEELIAAEPDPRNLLVVSSDHRVQRAARQRGAAFADSEAWHRELARRPRAAAEASAELPEKPETPSPEEVRQWQREFGGE